MADDALTLAVNEGKHTEPAEQTVGCEQRAPQTLQQQWVRNLVGRSGSPARRGW